MSKKILISYDFSNLEILNFKLQTLASNPALISGKPYYNSVTKKVMFGNDTTYYDPTDRTQHTGAQAISTVTGLQTALDAKATPAEVTAAITAVVGAAPAALDTLVEIATQLQTDEGTLGALITTVSGKADASALTSGLATKAATVHAHAIADVTGLQAALDAAAASGKYVVTVGGAASEDITHGIGTLDVIVQLYDVATGATVEADVTRTSTTHITVDFAVAPAAASIRVVVLG